MRSVLVFTLLLAFGGVAEAAPACSDVFAYGVVKSRVGLLEKWRAKNANDSLSRVASEAEIRELLNDLDLPLFADRLGKILDGMERRGLSGPDGFYEALRALLKQELVPSALVAKGIEQHRAGDVSSLRRMLGNLTFAETREMYIGRPRTSLDYTPDSLIGRYIQESGATTSVDVYADHRDKPFENKRLIVAVSAASFPIWKKYFSGRTMMTVFGHANMYTAGSAYSHQGDKGPLRAMRAGTPLPILILKPSEGERLYRYMELAALPKYRWWSNALKKPWKLNGYSAKGAYSCCTHWIGNIPIGDKLVGSYAFPGSQSKFKIADQMLQPWEDARYADLQQVWKAPGNEQLSSVIGLLEQNVAGEFASPGYVIQSLFGPAPVERVPIVFEFVKDHTQPLPKDIQLNMEDPV